MTARPVITSTPRFLCAPRPQVWRPRRVVGGLGSESAAESVAGAQLVGTLRPAETISRVAASWRWTYSSKELSGTRHRWRAPTWIELTVRSSSMCPLLAPTAVHPALPGAASAIARMRSSSWRIERMGSPMTRRMRIPRPAGVACNAGCG